MGGGALLPFVRRCNPNEAFKVWEPNLFVVSKYAYHKPPVHEVGTQPQQPPDIKVRMVKKKEEKKEQRQNKNDKTQPSWMTVVGVACDN